MKFSMIQQFLAARRCGTPLVSISTPDPGACIRQIREASSSKTPFVLWDCATGFSSFEGHKPGADAIRAAIDAAKAEPGEELTPDRMLAIAAHLPGIDKKKSIPGSVLFVHNAHRFLQGDLANTAVAVQALANLRDLYKEYGMTVVILGPSFQLPPELSADVLPLDDPLPGDEILAAIVSDMAQSVGIGEQLTGEMRDRACDALRGLPAFPAEQATALSMSPTGLDLAGLWERKRLMVEGTEGGMIRIEREGIRFADLAGIEEAKRLGTEILSSREAPRVIIFVDEIEKTSIVAGEHDSSGTSKDQLAVLLSEMQNKRHSGLICVGPPGAAKSAFAKAFGNEGGIPTISLDLGAAKGSLVGESERKIRTVLKVIDAVGGGRAFWVATSNDIAAIRPELLRRYKEGVMFFDLPTAEEREAIWMLYLAKYGLESEPRASIDDTWWAGAEIEKCCHNAWNKRITLVAAAARIIPVAKTDPERLDRLRRQAEGKYLSASEPGAYQYRAEEIAPRGARTTGGANGARAMNTEV